MEDLDSWVRSRIRLCYWKQWKNPQIRVRMLAQLGTPDWQANQWGNTRKGYWRTSHSPILLRALNNSFLRKEGYLSLKETGTLPTVYSNGPPYTEPYVRWLEGTAQELILRLPLNFTSSVMIQLAAKNLGIILNVVVLIFAVAMAFVPLRWDIIIRDANGKIRKLTTPGIIFIFFSLGALGFGVCKIANDDKGSQENRDALNGLKTQLASLNSKMDDEKAIYNDLKSDNQDLKTLVSDLISTDRDNTAKLVSRPTVFGKWQNPCLYTFDGDTVHCDFSLCNDEIGVAEMLMQIYMIGGDKGCATCSGYKYRIR